jgi:DNA polymerase III sliding clamp (beta) subunit (PCNA family)
VDNTLSVQATNASILYLHDTECVSKTNTSVIIPAKTCKILTSLEIDDFSFYQISGTEYRFQYQTIDIYFTAIDGKYPLVRSIVPKQSDHINVFSFKKQDIIKTISAVMITANVQTNGIQFYVGDETAKIKSIDLDNNMESEMELKVSVQKKADDVFKFAVNGKFITDVINSVNLPNSEQITFYMRELNKALLFYTDDFKTLHITMPIVFND